MKGLNYIKYALRDTFRALYRHKGMAFLSILTIATTLFVLGSVALLALNSQSASHEVENDLEMVVFLHAELPVEEAKAVGDKIRKIDAVKEATFVSRETALNDLNKRFSGQSDLKASLGGDNPLPDAYRVKVKEAKEIKGVADKITAFKEVQDVRYGENIVQNIVKLNQSVKFFVIGIILLMVLAALFLINSTISLTVSNRQEEIGIMAFIGAAPSYIRMPFFIEGIVIGGIGSMAAISILFLGYQRLASYMAMQLPFVPFFYEKYTLIVLFAGLVLLGIILGAVGSAMAVKKYLKV